MTSCRSCSGPLTVLPFGSVTPGGKTLGLWPRRLARWCNGSTADSGSVCHGSNPCRAANYPLRSAECGMRSETRSFALPQNLVRPLLRNALVKFVVTHHDRGRAAARKAFDEFDRELPILGRLRAVRVRVQAELA